MRFRYLAALLASTSVSLPAPAEAADEPTPAPNSPATLRLRELVALARERAPEVALGRAALTASRSSMASARLAPVGNPLFEVKVDHGTQGVTKDVTIDASVWLPVELAGEKQSRRREARDFINVHEALLGQARAQATARTVRAFGALAVATTRVRVLRELIEVARAEASYYAERLKVGDTTERDAALAALEVARHEALLSETEVDVVRQRGELRELTGRVLGADVALEDTPPRFHAERLAALPENTPIARVLQAEARFYGSSEQRLKREGYNPLSFGLTGGRGDYGEARIGGGLAYAFPLFRSNQPERARAHAARQRSLEELELRRELAARRVELIERELDELARALDVITRSALPAANRAVHASLETQRAGKGDWLSVLVSRRDLSSLSLRRLELLDKGWLLAGELSEITGEVP